MSVDFKTFVSLAPSVSAARLPVLLRGRHGIGKSQVVYQLAAAAGLPVVERRASQMTEGDLVGLPSVEGNRTSFNPPDWFKQACEEPVCLFLDEVDRATMEVRQGIFELTDSRKLNGWHLHPETLIMAAVNGGDLVAGEQGDVALLVPGAIRKQQSVRRFIVEIVREVNTVVCRIRLFTNDGDVELTGVRELGELVAEGIADHAVADDDQSRGWLGGYGVRAGLWRTFGIHLLDLVVRHRHVHAHLSLCHFL